MKTNTCFDCPFHEKHLIRSGSRNGSDPIHNHYCTNQNVPHHARWQGLAYIGRHDRRPQWCPLTIPLKLATPGIASSDLTNKPIAEYNGNGELRAGTAMANEDDLTIALIRHMGVLAHILEERNTQSPVVQQALNDLWREPWFYDFIATTIRAYKE